MERSQWPLEGRFVLYDNAGNAVAVDSTTLCLETVDHSRSAIHNGEHYYYSDYHDIVQNTVDEHLIITPNTTAWAHMSFEISSSAGQVIIELSEGATVSSNGTPESIFNRNRNFAANNTTLIYSAPTVLTQGTVIGAAKFGVGDKKITAGEISTSESEMVMKQNTIYLLRITELNIANTTVNLSIDWHEHTNM